MYVRSESPPPQRRLASGRGNLAPPPGLDLRNDKIQNQCVNRFQRLFLSELVLHYTSGWGGNRFVSTTALSEVAEAFGPALTIVGIGVSGYGALSGQQSWAEAGPDIAVGTIGLAL